MWIWSSVYYKQMWHKLNITYNILRLPTGNEADQLAISYNVSLKFLTWNRESTRLRAVACQLSLAQSAKWAPGAISPQLACSLQSRWAGFDSFTHSVWLTEKGQLAV